MNRLLVALLLVLPTQAFAVGGCTMPPDLDGISADFYHKMYCIQASSANEYGKLFKKTGDSEAGTLADGCVKVSKAYNDIYARKSEGKRLDYIEDCVGNHPK